MGFFGEDVKRCEGKEVTAKIVVLMKSGLLWIMKMCVCICTIIYVICDWTLICEWKCTTIFSFCLETCFVHRNPHLWIVVSHLSAQGNCVGRQTTLLASKHPTSMYFWSCLASNSIIVTLQSLFCYNNTVWPHTRTKNYMKKLIMFDFQKFKPMGIRKSRPLKCARTHFLKK